jgi:hypothetical protein
MITPILFQLVHVTYCLTVCLPLDIYSGLNIYPGYIPEEPIPEFPLLGQDVLWNCHISNRVSSESYMITKKVFSDVTVQIEQVDDYFAELNAYHDFNRRSIKLALEGEVYLSDRLKSDLITMSLFLHNTELITALFDERYGFQRTLT